LKTGSSGSMLCTVCVRASSVTFASTSARVRRNTCQPYDGMLKNGLVHAWWRRRVQSIIAHIPDDADDLGFVSCTPQDIPQPSTDYVSLR
jgi:hypothetical protein